MDPPLDPPLKAKLAGKYHYIDLARLYSLYKLFILLSTLCVLTSAIKS